jgi:DNA-binding NarL/FixJ family response regulator
MKILIDLSSAIISEAIRSLLCENDLEAQNGSHDALFVPDIVLADINTVCDDLFSNFPESKVLLLDTGVKKEKLAEALLSYEISGIISADTGFSLFRKALTVVNEGRVWIDKSTIRSFLNESDLVAKKELFGRKKVAASE